MDYKRVIGIDASRANEQKKTGVGWYCFHVIEELKKLPITHYPLPITFILYSRKPLQGDLAKLPEGWESRVLGWPPKRLWTQVRMSWEMLFHAPDVLFIPAHVSPLIHPKKTVMTVHDVAAVRFPESYSRFEQWYSLWSTRIALKRLWKIIVPSEFTKSELKSLEVYNVKSSVEVIPHGYDSSFVKIDDERKIGEVLKKYNIEKPFIMSIGRLERKKNTVNIVKSFNLLRKSLLITHYSLLLVGDEGHGFEEVRKEIDQSKFKADIITPGWVDQEDMPHLMSAADVFVFPSLYEGFGIPVLEAMACGTPVVASRGNCLVEVGGDAPIYIDSYNVESISVAVESLLEDDVMRNEKIARGLKRINQFSWRGTAEETLRVLLEERF